MCKKTNARFQPPTTVYETKLRISCTHGRMAAVHWCQCRLLWVDVRSVTLVPVSNQYDRDASDLNTKYSTGQCGSSVVCWRFFFFFFAKHLQYRRLYTRTYAHSYEFTHILYLLAPSKDWTDGSDLEIYEVIIYASLSNQID